MEMNSHQRNSLQQNPDNPPPSPLPPRPAPEANNNLAQTQPAQQQNLKRPSESNQVSVPSGIPPLPNSSNNSGRKRRSRKSKSTQQTDMSPQPPFSPQIPQTQLLQQQDSLRQMEQNLLLQQQWRRQLLPQPQEQRSPQMMQRCMRQSNMQRDQRLSYSNFLVEVMHYQWSKPQNNSIAFWRQYVFKYYDPRAKERRCLSMCNDNGTSSSNDTWHCSLCGWKPGRGFEVSYEGLPDRLKFKFDRMDGERLYVGMAQEHKSAPGVTILLYPKATQRSIYGRQSVVYEGLLRVAITDQLKILSWEFCVSRREAYVSFPPLPSRGDDWLGIGEIFRRPEAKNVADEKPEEGSQRNNNNIAQDARPQADKNTGLLTFQTGNNLDFSENCPCPKGVKACDSMEGFMDFSMQKELESIGLQNSRRPCPASGLQRQEMMAKHQGKAQGQQINYITMNSTRAIHPGPSSHDISNHYRVIGGQNANRMSAKAVSIGVDNIQTAASPVDSRGTCLIRNPAANLPTPRAEEPLVSHSNINNSQATHTDRSSHKNNEHHMIIGGQNATGIPAGGVRVTQTAAASPVESGETGLIPNPATELQVQEMPVKEHPTSAQQPLTNYNTMNSPMVIHDKNIFIDQQNGVDITQATVLADEDIETYLIDNPAAQFHTQEMQVMNYHAGVQGQPANHNPMMLTTVRVDTELPEKSRFQDIARVLSQ